MFRFLASIFLLIFSYQTASAQQSDCQQYANEAIADGELVDLVRYSVPQEYAALISEIEFVFTTEGMIPEAIISQGKPQILVPVITMQIMCELVKADILFTGNVTNVDQNSIDDMQAFFLEVWPTAIAGYGDCIRLREQETCFLEAARKAATLAQDQADKRGSSTDLSGNTAQYWVEYIIVNNGMRALIMHEVAHHLLDHFGRLKQRSISRREAEAEADEFALVSAQGIGTSGLGYTSYFNALTRVDAELPNHTTSFYESWSCRASVARSYDLASSTVFFLVLTSIQNNHRDTSLAMDLTEALLERDAIIETYQKYETSGYFDASCPVLPLAKVLTLHDDTTRIVQYLVDHLDAFWGNSQTVYPDFALLDVFRISEVETSEAKAYVKARIMLATLIHWLKKSNDTEGSDPGSLVMMVKILEYVAEKGTLGDSMIARGFLSQDIAPINNLSGEAAFKSFMSEFSVRLRIPGLSGH